MRSRPDRHPPGSWVEMSVWGVSGRYVPFALARMGTDRLWLRQAPGLRFAKSLGTGLGDTFALRDADLRHWALLTVWDTPADAARFRAGPLHRSWARLADETLTVEMTPLWARGRWAGRTPFSLPGPEPDPATGPIAPAGPIAPGAPIAPGGPVAVVTRARLRVNRMRTFWAAVPPVARSLRTAPGIVLAMSMGESPLALMGTFSLWSDADSMLAYAHRDPAHVNVIRQTGVQRWYAEELFARFAVRSAHGQYRGRAIGL